MTSSWVDSLTLEGTPDAGFRLLLQRTGSAEDGGTICLFESEPFHDAETFWTNVSDASDIDSTFGYAEIMDNISQIEEQFPDFGRQVRELSAEL